MNKNDLITEKPVVKLKGFKSTQIKVVPAIPKDFDIQRTLLKCKNSPEFERLSDTNKEIIRQFVFSYERKTAGLPMEEKDYVLSGHEFLEWDRLEAGQELRYLTYRYRYSKYPELHLVDAYPPCIQIEPSSICNFRCIMCYQSDASFSTKQSGYMGYMPLELFKKAIDEIEGHIEAVTLASRGEPTLNRDFVRMLEYCRDKFLGLKINTNASVLTDELIHSFFTNDVNTVVFSIDSADKEMYEKIRVGGKFESLIRNLEKFREIKTKHYSNSKTIVRISGVKINEKQNIEAMDDVWKRYADIIAFTNYTPWQNTYENEVNQIDSPCSELWRRIFVWQDGAVNPCDYDYKSQLSKWKLQDKSITQIWTSPEYDEYRRMHLSKERSKLEPCRRCISV